MTIRHIAATALALATLAAGPALAADFASDLREAKAANGAWAEREIRDTVTTHLSVAESLHARGRENEARQYLNFARGMLDLDPMAGGSGTQVGEAPGQRSGMN